MVTEPVVGVVVGVAVELVRRAVEMLAAALGVDQNHHPWAAPVFRIEIPGKCLEFAHRVDAQVSILTVVGANVGVDDSVEKKVIVGAAHAVDVEVVGLVKHQAELRVVVSDHAGQCGHQRLEVAPVQRLLDDLALVDDC